MYPKDYQLNHSWLSNLKPNQMARNNLKYLRVDAQLRAKQRAEWNRPALWPFAALIALLAAVTFPGYRYYRRKEEMRAG